jgi:dihydroorotase
MSVDLVIRGGRVVTEKGAFYADVAIDSGLIAAIIVAGDPLPDARDEFDATGLLVFPGFIDGHVHFREPGLEWKEDFGTGSAGAVAGGVTTVLEMPNTIPPTDSLARLREKLLLAAGHFYCDYGFFGLLASGNPDVAVEILSSGLVSGLKAYLGPTTGGLPAPDDETIRVILSDAARLGVRTAFHAEDELIITQATAAVRGSGRTDPFAFAESRPPAAEVAGLDRIGRLAVLTGARVHACHVSTRAGLATIQAWRRAGADFSCEVTAHHCFLSTRDFERIGSLARVNPPLREPDDSATLLAALGDGQIDIIASDHAPHEVAVKRQSDIWQAMSGFTGVETTPLLFLTHGVQAGFMSLTRFVVSMSGNPARLWGLWPRKGQIATGSDADLAIVDPAQPGFIRSKHLHGRSNHTPFEGWRTGMSVRATFLRGHCMMREGVLVGPPAGVHVRPTSLAGLREIEA